jgi:quercetin dioxygenase-like cupin family protein
MRSIFMLALPLLLASSAAQGKAGPAELKWMDSPPPGLPAGATFAVVSGNPAKAGKFTIRIKMPSNYSVPPHWHPSDEHVTLVSGKLAYGMSDRIDRAGAEALAAGGTIVMKAKHHHWVFTGDGAEVEVSATGPFAITYVDPTTDPRGVAKPKTP